LEPFKSTDDVPAYMPKRDRHGVEMRLHFAFTLAAKEPGMEIAGGITWGVLAAPEVIVLGAVMKVKC